MKLYIIDYQKRGKNKLYTQSSCFTSLNAMCNLCLNKSIKLKRFQAKEAIEKNTNCMPKDFTSYPAGHMPHISGPDFFNIETVIELSDDRFNLSAYRFEDRD